jgi:hypothetical protein
VPAERVPAGRVPTGRVPTGRAPTGRAPTERMAAELAVGGEFEQQRGGRARRNARLGVTAAMAAVATAAMTVAACWLIGGEIGPAMMPGASPGQARHRRARGGHPQPPRQELPDETHATCTTGLPGAAEARARHKRLLTTAGRHICPGVALPRGRLVTADPGPRSRPAIRTRDPDPACRGAAGVWHSTSAWLMDDHISAKTEMSVPIRALA